MFHHSHPLGQGLSIVRGSLDIIPLIDLHSPIEDIPYHHEVNLPPRTLILHLVESVDAHEEGLGVAADVLHVIANNFPQFAVLLPRDGFDDDLGVLSVVHETATLP